MVKARNLFSRSAVAAIAVAAWLGASTAHANPDLPVYYDARSVGMGGAAIAFLGNPTAMLHNPANLSSIERFSINGTITLFQPTNEAPFLIPPTDPMSAPTTQSFDSEASIFPLPFLGVAGRVHDRVVIGGGAYFVSGVGSEYTLPALGTLKLEIAVSELALPVAVQITDELSVGVAVRVGYAMQRTTQPLPPSGPMMEPGEISQKLSGISFPAATLGVTYRPLPELSLALVYRSKMKTNIDGNSTINGMDFDSESEWLTAHSLRAGIAGSLLQHRLVLALDGKYTFTGESNERQVIDTNIMGSTMRTDILLDWENILTGNLGVEFWAHPMFAVRTGYSISQSATPESLPNPFTPSPGLLHAVTGGLGLRLEHVDVDAAGAVSFGSNTSNNVRTDLPDGQTVPAPGEYSVFSWYASLSATYHL